MRMVYRWTSPTSLVEQDHPSAVDLVADDEGVNIDSRWDPPAAVILPVPNGLVASGYEVCIHESPNTTAADIADDKARMVHLTRFLRDVEWYRRRKTEGIGVVLRQAQLKRLVSARFLLNRGLDDTESYSFVCHIEQVHVNIGIGFDCP